MENRNPAAVSGLFSRGPRYLWAWLLYLLLIGYLYSFSQYGFNIWDEGGYANGTLRTLNGEQAMVDFNPSGYLPARYLYGAFFFKLFGIDIRSLRIGVILFTPAMVFLVYVASKKIMPTGFAFLAALAMLSAPGMYYNRFFPFFSVLNLYFLLNLIEKRRLQEFLLLAVSILVSIFFKFEVGLFSTVISIAFLPIILFRSSGNKSFKLFDKSGNDRAQFFGLSPWVTVTLLMVTIGLTIIYFVKSGFYDIAVKLIIDAHNVWGNPFPSLFPFFALFKEHGPHEMFERVLFYLPIGVYGVISIVLLSRFLKTGRESETIDLHLLAILSFGICSFGLVIWRAGFDNLLRTLPPFYILFCYLLFLLRSKILQVQNSFEPGYSRSSWMRRIPLNVLTVALPFLFFYEMNVNHGFYAGTPGAIKQETSLVKLNRMQVYTNPSEAEWIPKVVERIEAHTLKGDPILALPLNPIFYFLTDRINPIPYDWILPGMLDDEEEKQVVDQLKQNPPRLIIYVDIAIDGKEDRRLSNYAPEIFKFIFDNYLFKEYIGMFQILLPKDSPTIPVQPK